MSREWTNEELLAYAAGELDRSDQNRIERILHKDSKAAAIVARFRAVALLVKSDDSTAPTARAINRAAALMTSSEAVQRRPEKRLSWLDRLDAIVAELLFDSRLQPLAVRGHTAELVQLAYQVGEHEVELRAQWAEREDGEGRWRIMGQISPVPSGKEETIVALVVRGESEAIEQTHCDETGMFALEATPGAYDLCVRLPGQERADAVVLPDIDLS